MTLRVVASEGWCHISLDIGAALPERNYSLGGRGRAVSLSLSTDCG